MTTPEPTATLIEGLRNPAAYPHPVYGIEVLETHISWIVLTGTYAYKIKKPLDLGFLDYSTLERRRNFCHEELRLNRRTAPELYLEVAAITRGSGGLSIDGPGEPLEYAVKMRQFPSDALLADQLARGSVDRALIQRLMSRIARFHQEVARAPADSPWGEPAAIHAPMQDNFRTLRELVEDHTLLPWLDAQAAWCRETFTTLERTLRTRAEGGFIRECHGDLHLGNIAVLDGEPIPFDCIEFNPGLRWIDVMSELAFLLMDFEQRGHAGLGHIALNDYLSHTGDYPGLALLPWYIHYRAMVRAKIAQLRLAQPSVTGTERLQLHEEFGGYLTLASHYTERPRPYLLITHGLSGTGKSRHTEGLVERLGLVRLRSDVERKRLFGMGSDARTGAALSGGIYARDASERTYERLAELAQSVLAAGFPVVVDATFLARQRREQFRALAQTMGVPFAILEFTAQPEVLEARVERRARKAADPSEATVEVLREQQRTLEGLSDEERLITLTIDTGQPVDLDVVIPALSERVR